MCDSRSVPLIRAQPAQWCAEYPWVSFRTKHHFLSLAARHGHVFLTSGDLALAKSDSGPGPGPGLGLLFSLLVFALGMHFPCVHDPGPLIQDGATSVSIL